MASAVVGALRVLLEVNASQLESEFGKATITVGNFDKFTQNAGRNLQRMVEGFSGQKIVAEATTMAAAIEKVGGVSALTERELKRVAGTVEQATAKLKAMGVAVPPSIAKLNTEIEGLQRNTIAGGSAATTFGKAWTAVGPLLPITSVIGLTTAIVGMGKTALESAGHIVDLSNKTGLSTDTIQEMQAVAVETGTTVDAFTTSVFKLGINIANGTTKARDAVAALGLSFSDLEEMAPEEQFNRVIRALEEEENVGKRNAAGRALFGAQWAEIAASVEEGYFKIADAATKSSDAQLKALDAAGDAWDRLSNTLTSVVRSAMGDTALAIEGVIGAVQRLGSLDMLQVIGAAMSAGVSPEQMLIAMGRAFAETGDAAAKAKPQIQETAKVFEDYSGRILAATAELADLDKTTLSQIATAKRLGASTQELNEQFGISEDALRLMAEQERAAAKSASDYEKQATKAAAAQKKFNEEVRKFAEQNTSMQTALKEGWFGKIETELKDNFTLIAATGDEMGRAQQEAERWAFTHGAVLMPAVKASGVEIEKAKKKTIDWSDQLRNLAQSFANLAQIVGQNDFGTFVKATGEVIGSMALASDGLDAFKKGWERFDEGDFVNGFAQMASGIMGVVGAMEQATRGTNTWKAALSGAATGFMAGGIWGAIGGFIIGTIRSQNAADDAEKQLAEQAAKTRAELMKQYEAMKRTAESMVKLIALLGQTEAIATMFAEAKTAEDVEAIRKELERITEEGVKINDEFRDLFDLIETSGFAIPQEMQDFLSSFMDLLDPANQAKLQSLFGMMSGQEVPWEKMQAAAEKFGIDIGSLGQKFQAGKLKASATEIINAFELLTKNGADVGGVLFGMRDEISKLVQDAKKFKTEIPEQMRPWIEELRRSGNLVDENGNALEDLGDVRFGPPIVSQFDMVIKKIGELIDRFGDLIDVINGVKGPDIKVPGAPAPAPGAAPGGDYRFFPEPDPVPFASGGVVTRRTFAVLGESGPEMVVPLRRYANPSAVPIPNIGSLVPDLGKMPSDMPGGQGDYGSDFREAIAEMREEMKGWFETFTDAIALTLRDARSGAY